MSRKKKTDVTTESTERGKPVYNFSHGRRCPACRSADTEARSTQDDIQYRHCRRVGCTYNHKLYPVIGKTV